MSFLLLALHCAETVGAGSGTRVELLNTPVTPPDCSSGTLIHNIAINMAGPSPIATKLKGCASGLRFGRVIYNSIDATADDSAGRRMPTPDYPQCETQFCPVGPCSLFDYDYQTDVAAIRYDTSSPIQLNGKVRCGPSFGVTTVNNNEEAPVTPETNAAFPSVYRPGIPVYNRAINVPVKYNLKNGNPRTYYKNELAWNTNSPTVPFIRSTIFNSVPMRMPSYTTTAGNGMNYTVIGELPVDLIAKDHDFQTKQSKRSDPWWRQMAIQLDGSNEFANKNFSFLSNFNTDSGDKKPVGYCDTTKCVYVPAFGGGTDDSTTASPVVQMSVFLLQIATIIEDRQLRSQRQSYQDPPEFFKLKTLDGLDAWRAYGPFPAGKAWGNYVCLPLGEGAKLSSMNHGEAYPLSCTNFRLNDVLLCLKKDEIKLPTDNGRSTDDKKKQKENKENKNFKQIIAALIAYNTSNPNALPLDEVFNMLHTTPKNIETFEKNEKGETAGSFYYAPEAYEWAAVAAARTLPVSPVTQNASFLNTYSKSESAACDCGNTQVRYAVLDIPWSSIPSEYETVYKGGDSTTVLREMSYGWDHAQGDVRNGMPVGLYLPSSPRHGRNFVIYERDFLREKQTGVNSSTKFVDLVNDTFTGKGAPLAAYLQNNLVFNVSRFRGQPYYSQEIVYTYGACMRPPYGRLARMEMDKPAADKYFPGCNNSDALCTVNEMSLMGYCEKMGSAKHYPFCARDPMTALDRDAFCKKQRAQTVVLAVTLGERARGNVCSIKGKTCLIIPGEPTHTLDAVLSGSLYGDLSAYTILITPFNWSVASALMRAGRKKYTVGSGLKGKENISQLLDTDTTLTGMTAISKNDFTQLLNQDNGTSKVQDAVLNICTALTASIKKNNGVTTYDLPFLYEVPVVTDKYLFPPLQFTQTHVVHASITILNAWKGVPLKFVRPIALVHSTAPCTLFYVSAPGFTLPPPGVWFDQSHCIGAVGIDATPIVFGGANVTGANICLNTSGTTRHSPVVFAGENTAVFGPVKSVNASGSVLNITTTGTPPTFVVGAALTFGTIKLVLPNTNGTVDVVVQPANNRTITFVSNATVVVLNATRYTKVFGAAVMSLEYPETASSNHAAIVVFVILCFTIFIVTLSILLQCHGHYYDSKIK